MTPKHIDDLTNYFGDEVYWLNSERFNGAKFSRYAVPTGDPVWICDDCGAIVEFVEEGCQECKSGIPIPYDDLYGEEE